MNSANQVSVNAESIAFNASQQRWTGNKENNQNFNQYANKDMKRNNNFCSYYKKQRHTKDKCYKLVGFPQSFKFTK